MRIGVFALSASFALGACASPLAKAKQQNSVLAAQLDELQQQKRAQDLAMKDLEKRISLLHRSVPREVVPPLAVTVLTPEPAQPANLANPYGDSDLGAWDADLEDADAAAFDELAPEVTAPAPRQASSRTVTIRPRTFAASGPSHLPKQTRAAKVALPLAPAAARAPASVRSEDAGNQYREAVALLKAGNHSDALAKLAAFIASHPNHDYADNAQYWIGEAYYDQKDYVRAVTEFRATVERYPQGNKVPDAMLKIGYCYYAVGDTAKAKAVLGELIANFPKSEPAMLATKRMETP